MLHNYDELKPGVKIISVDAIKTETRILAEYYLCMVVEDEDGEHKRIMCPVASRVEARPHTGEMIRICDAGSEFFSIHDIAMRDRGEPLLYASNSNQAETIEHEDDAADDTD
jgi:hypothetical protein